MSEWLTTGAMIDKLKVGEEAETKEGFRVIKRENGSITWSHDGDNSFNFLSINIAAMKLKWRIHPNYVSFEEAMKALKEGKTLILHHNGEKTLFRNWFRLETREQVTFMDLFEGQWEVLEADTQ